MTLTVINYVTQKESNVSKSKKIKLSNVAQPIKITV